MEKVFSALVASLLVVLVVTVALLIPSFFAGIALWFAWNSLLGVFVATTHEIQAQFLLRSLNHPV